MTEARKLDVLERLMRLLPGLFLASLLVCFVTGALLLSQYRPMGDVMRGVEAITTQAPFGFFFRRVHFASGQACALLALLHALRFVAVRPSTRRPGRWFRLTAGLAVCFVLLITGFILKGDADARFAGTVLRGLAESVPVVGGSLCVLAVGAGDAFFLPPYVLHCFVLPVSLLALLGGHVRIWRPGCASLAAAALIFGAWGVFVPMPPALPPDAAPLAAGGPWFLYGMQEALRYAPPLAAGVIAPALLFGVFAVLPALRGALGRGVRCVMVYGTGLYVVVGIGLAVW